VRLETSGRETNTVWLAPSATTFSCLCERCLEAARERGGSFLDAVSVASVTGAVPDESDVAFAHCRAGHEIVVRRIERPPALARSNERQLQLT
jgi:hypothetical protein